MNNLEFENIINQINYKKENIVVIYIIDERLYGKPIFSSYYYLVVLKEGKNEILSIDNATIEIINEDYFLNAIFYENNLRYLEYMISNPEHYPYEFDIDFIVEKKGLIKQNKQYLYLNQFVKYHEQH